MAAASVTVPSVLQASSFCSGIESRSSRKDATTSAVSFSARTAYTSLSSLCPSVFHPSNSSCCSKFRTKSTPNVVPAAVLSEEEIRQFGAGKALKENRARASDDRKRQSFLEYEALKRELSLMTLGVAGFCTLYCLVTLSVEQSAVSYDIGAGASLLYLQLLYREADNLSEGRVAEIFKPKRFKKKTIGIRSEDVKEGLEKSIRGTGMALSSPRLVIPAALFGLWSVSAKITGTTGLHLEVAPMMFGFFAYKGAALIQAYRDNKDLLMVFEKNEEETM
ncbi:hypothetical protein R1sor_010406 [Riccia sorocarpa]|uniref:Uncharacterized protein n=1 Tax=Riccia sorocarpa TaxID=122646 RepID=A0ABD3HXY5_9MARC